jgi:MSHA pilin protein MshA
VALPKFVDLSGDAKSAALKGVVGAAGSAMTINYSSCAVVSNVASVAAPFKCRKVDDCNDIGSLLEGGLPNGYTIAAGALGTGTSGSNGVEGTCTLTQTDGAATGTFTGVSAGNN